MTSSVLVELVRSAAHDVLAERGLDLAALPAAFSVTRPRDAAHGDFATNLAMQAASPLGVPVGELAAWLATGLSGRATVRSAEVTGPGFVGLRLTAQARSQIVRSLLDGGPDQADRRMVGLVVAERLSGVLTDDLVAAVGRDAARYALLRHPAARPADVDPATWIARTDDNPLFRVQYAHSRLAAIGRGAAELGLVGPVADLDVLTADREVDLIHAAAEFDGVLDDVLRQRAPHLLVRYLERLADEFGRFQDSCPVLPTGTTPAGPVPAARVALSAATRVVFARGLALLDLNAPELT